MKHSTTEVNANQWTVGKIFSAYENYQFDLNAGKQPVTYRAPCCVVWWASLNVSLPIHNKKCLVFRPF